MWVVSVFIRLINIIFLYKKGSAELENEIDQREHKFF